ncbi:MAG: SRPBCC family protein [Balneolaceae bacterium]|nr:SRPBCC family protein [Balneolaceae bacterium]MCH8549519.1 SRPBCC family protein [Balneolaceae bacterium]
MPFAIRILKIIGSIFLLLVAALFGASFIADTEFETERSIVIDKPIAEVFEYVRYLENQYEYSVWGSIDPDLKKEFRGTDGTVGFLSAWEGNEEAGSGEQEIIAISEGERIDYELRFFEPFESTALSFMETEEVDENSTRVTWGMSGSFSRPMNAILLFMDLESAIGDDYERGLNNLKELLENRETSNHEQGSD